MEFLSMKKIFIQLAGCILINFVFLPASAQQQQRDYEEIVLDFPGIGSDKIYDAVKNIYNGMNGIEIMLRCNQGEMLVLKIDTRINPEPDKLLRKLTENSFKATIRQGFDYNMAVVACSDFK